MPISVVFDPPLPSDSPSTFNTKAFTLLGDLNDWSTQANALPGEVATNLSALLASPPAIGGTTPAAGSFTTLSASGDITQSTSGARLTYSTTTGNGGIQNNNGTSYALMFGSSHATEPGNVWINSNSTVKIKNAGNDIATVSSSGLAVTGALSASGNITQTGVSGVTTLTVFDNKGSATSESRLQFGANNGVFVANDAARIWTTPSSGTTASLNFAAYNGGLPSTPQLKLDAGAVTIPGSLSLTGGTLGYGTGAGGTVTQATSKSTAVTLNKPCGQITMVNSALGAGTSVYFAVYNSFYATTDLAVINVVGGIVSPDTYDVSVTPVNTGIFYVNLKNRSAGPLSDSVVVGFAIIKGATS